LKTWTGNTGDPHTFTSDPCLPDSRQLTEDPMALVKATPKLTLHMLATPHGDSQKESGTVRVGASPPRPRTYHTNEQH